MTYLILGVVSAIVALAASLVIAWAVKRTPVDKSDGDGVLGDVYRAVIGKRIAANQE